MKESWPFCCDLFGWRPHCVYVFNFLRLCILSSIEGNLTLWRFSSWRIRTNKCFCNELISEFTVCTHRVDFIPFFILVSPIESSAECDSLRFFYLHRLQSLHGESVTRCCQFIFKMKMTLKMLRYLRRINSKSFDFTRQMFIKDTYYFTKIKVNWYNLYCIFS